MASEYDAEAAARKVLQQQEVEVRRKRRKWKVVRGDCLGLLRHVASDSVGAIVTDPPYGLNFMGKDWDRALPDPRVWAEALRVMKPGGHLVAFGHPRLYHRLACQIEDAGWEIRDCIMWLYGTGFPKSHNLGGEWEGWGTALKPAYEPILVARKPLIGTVAANVLEHGTGAINVDGCRVGTSKRHPGNYRDNGAIWGNAASSDRSGFNANAGRWPANVILDEAAGALLDAQSGELASGGGASRFFYTAKASRKEREAGLQAPEGDRANRHPTVKPIALMRWLVRLVAPPGEMVLDPFAGSGSTGCAATMEGRRFLGFEIDPDHVTISERRIKHWGEEVTAAGARRDDHGE